MPIRKFENLLPSVALTAYVDPLAVIIGEVTIGDYASVWPMVVARGDINRITIGARTNIQDGTVLHVTHEGRYSPGYPLVIGEEVTVGHQATLHACTIEHHCLIGIGSIILDGVMLQPYTLLAAGSLVPPKKVLDSGYLWRGRPVEKIRPVTPSEMEYFAYLANYYVELGQRHQRESLCQ